MALADVKLIVEIAQGLTTIAAILIGGFWTYRLFVKERQQYPRANLEHRITHVPFGNDLIAIHVILSVSNVGNTLLSIHRSAIRIQQMQPVPLAFIEHIRKEGDRLQEGPRIPWPRLYIKEYLWRDDNVEVEPGESADISYDLTIRNTVQTIMVFNYVQNAVKRKKEIGWTKTTIYHL